MCETDTPRDFLVVEFCNNFILILLQTVYLCLDIDPWCRMHALCTNRTASPSQSRGQIDSNRAEVLRCLLVCFSEGVYSPPERYQPSINRYLAVLTSPDQPLAPTIFYSLLNTVCSYDPVGYLPYTYALFTDYRETLVDMAVQVMLVYHLSCSHCGMLLCEFLSACQPVREC